MIKTKKKLITISLATILLLMTAGCGKEKTEGISSETPDSFTIRVGVNAGDGNQLLSILDKHTGFFKEKGINFEVTEFAAGINTIDAITTDQLDVGLFADYAGVNRIGNTINDSELRAFATINKTNAFNLYVNPEVVTSVEDLAGQTVISSVGVVYEYEYGKLFETYGIEPSSVKFANVSSVQEALAVGQAKDGVSWWVHPNSAPLFEEIGWKPLVNIEEVGATMYTFLVANDSYLTEHKADVVKFLTASDEAFKYIDEHQDEFFTWVEEDLGLSKELSLASWNSQTHEYTFPQDAYDDLVSVEKWCYANGNFDIDYDFGNYINTDALEEAFPDRVSWSRK